MNRGLIGKRRPNTFISKFMCVYENREPEMDIFDLNPIELPPRATNEDVVALINHRLCNWEDRKVNGLLLHDSIEPLRFRTRKGGVIKVSVQAGKFFYSTPREDFVARFANVEVGFPSWTFADAALEWAEDRSDPAGTIYSYIPIELIAAEIIRAVNELAGEVSIPKPIVHEVNSSALWS